MSYYLKGFDIHHVAKVKQQKMDNLPNFLRL